MGQVDFIVDFRNFAKKLYIDVVLQLGGILGIKLTPTNHFPHFWHPDEKKHAIMDLMAAVPPRLKKIGRLKLQNGRREYQNCRREFQNGRWNSKTPLLILKRREKI